MNLGKPLMNMLSRCLGGLSVIAGCTTVALAQQPAGPRDTPMVSNGDAVALLALFTSAAGAAGAWLSPMVREWMATRRYESQDHVFGRECWRWIRQARANNPGLPEAPDPPHGWADDPDESVTDLPQLDGKPKKQG